MMICMCCHRLMYLGTYRNFPVSQFQNYLCQITPASIKTYYTFYFLHKVEIFIKQIPFALLIYVANGLSFRYSCTLVFLLYCFHPCPKTSYQLNLLIWTKVQMKTTIWWWKKFINDSHNEAGWSWYAAHEESWQDQEY